MPDPDPLTEILTTTVRHGAELYIVCALSRRRERTIVVVARLATSGWTISGLWMPPLRVAHLPTLERALAEARALLRSYLTGAPS